MPNRYLRASYIDSKRINSLSANGERMFCRLIATVDDFGRYEADSDLLRGKLFARQLEKVRERDIDAWLKELEDNDLVILYTVDGQEYLQMQTWEQGRAKTSKYPNPPADAHKRAHLRAAANKSPDSDSDSDTDCDTDTDFAKFWCAYPRKVGKSAAMKAWKLAKHPPIDTVLAKIAALKSTDQWRKDNGQFIPHPTTWIRRGGWDDEAVSAESGVASTDDEWSRAYRDIAESIWRAQADNYEGGLKRAMQKARDTYGDIPKKNGVDVVNAAIGMAMNNQRPKDWAMQ